MIFFFTSACLRENLTVGTTVEGYVINYEDSNKVSDATIFLLHWGGNSESDTIITLDTQSDSNGYYYLEFEGKPHGWYWIKAEKAGYNPSEQKLIDAGASSYRYLLLNPQ
jgi:hypothetical protein